jgi:hypothetical protein
LQRPATTPFIKKSLDSVELRWPWRRVDSGEVCVKVHARLHERRVGCVLSRITSERPGAVASAPSRKRWPRLGDISSSTPPSSSALESNDYTERGRGMSGFNVFTDRARGSEMHDFAADVCFRHLQPSAAPSYDRPLHS